MNPLASLSITDLGRRLDEVTGSIAQAREEGARILNELANRMKKSSAPLNQAIEQARRPLPSTAFETLLTKAIATVCEQFEVIPDALLGNTRTKNVVEPRIALYRLLREHSKASLTEIGDALDKDHGTILSGCRRAAALAETDSAYAAKLNRCREQIKTALAAAPDSVAKATSARSAS